MVTIIDTKESQLYIDDTGMLKQGFSDFSGKRNISNKKYNKKYLLYTDHGESVARAHHYESMEVIQVVPFKNDSQIIFYSDSLGRVSFVLSKVDPSISPFEIADKVEKKPMTKTKAFMFFSFVLFIGILRFRNNDSVNPPEISVGVKKTNNYNIRFLFPRKIRNKFSMNTNKLALFIHSYYAIVPLRDIYRHYLNTSDINVPIFVKVLNKSSYYFYNFQAETKSKFNRKNYLYNTKSTRVKGSDNEMYLRKSITGQFVIVVTSRLSNVIVFKEWVAYLSTLLVRKKDKYDLFFEKFSLGASESAFELFKYNMSTKSSKRCVYILDKESPDYEDLKRKYPNNLFAKNSIKAFYHMFLARSFVSSDLVSHIQRRLYDNDQLLKKKILNNKHKIFLQHGPSLATNVFDRGYYNKKIPIAPDYIIVNSQFERDIFLENSSYKKNELIVSGQPNIDLYVKSKNENKDEITFLLTWRPWDLTGSSDNKNSYISRYFQFIDTIKSNKFYEDKKINIILHPKAKLILQEQFADFYSNNEKYFYSGDIKSALLKSKVLISDYSSVTYMAFSGGTNIVFYWEDKELCEKEYGSPNILQENIAFGDISYNFSDLDKEIRKNYMSGQRNEHIKTYSRLVECTDGNNTHNTLEHLSSIINE
ncbi:CDP-glycerol glycerophosphotransferase family protein [Bacillus spongiae]|uniref:CDP-glycerol glycerophosphotransferase family protein n=1 Tax=Bacillus spongiae TaxID=2683610 RepID=A0ABU8HK27_9BACI